MAVSIVMSFGMPVFWNVTVGQYPTVVWTSCGTLLMLASIVFGRAHRQVDPQVLSFLCLYLGLYAVGTLLSYLLVGEPTQERESLLLVNTGTLMLGAIHFLFGAQISANRRWGAPLGMLMVYVFIGTYAFLNRDVLLSAEMITRLNIEQLFVEYQYLGDYFAIASIVLMSYIRPRHPVLLALSLIAFSALTLALLFIIPSRSAAILGGFSLLIGMLLRMPMRPRVMTIIALVVVGVTLRNLPIPSLAEGTRFESIVSEPDRDQSVMKRVEIMHEGLSSIGENPILGNWAFQLERLGSADYPIHNALDVWAQAGLLPFLLFGVLWAVVGWHWWCMYCIDREAAARALPGLSFALLSWLISRQAAHVLPLFCLGYAASVRVPWEVFRGRASPRRRKTAPTSGKHTLDDQPLIN